MNRFFQRGAEQRELSGMRLYARRIDGVAGISVLFDAIDACWFDDQIKRVGGPIQWQDWLGLSDWAEIYAVEVNANTTPAAKSWFKSLTGALPRWVEMEVTPDPNGVGFVYQNIDGAGRPCNLTFTPLARKTRQLLKAATDLKPHLRPENDILSALPYQAVDQIIALDVGQGAANALLGHGGEILAYVDTGAGVLADAGTCPSPHTQLCLRGDPTVILTHWHYDHFDGANICPGAKALTWIAPLQTLGPGPQSAMASDIVLHGKLLVWGGSGRISGGAIELERCAGPSHSQNRTGIAVWVHGPLGDDPILLPGDAAYKDIASLSPTKPVTGFTAAHHGGIASGVAPKKPSSSKARVAMSYGNGNSYGHPLTTSITRITASGWRLGHPGKHMDERRTGDRPAGAGSKTGYGHIRLQWPTSVGTTPPCRCGCTLQPFHV